jgi:hypothetical protein
VERTRLSSGAREEKMMVGALYNRGSPIRRQVKKHRHSCGKFSCSLFSTP